MKEKNYAEKLSKLKSENEVLGDCLMQLEMDLRNIEWKIKDIKSKIESNKIAIVKYIHTSPLRVGDWYYIYSKFDDGVESIVLIKVLNLDKDGIEAFTLTIDSNGVNCWGADSLGWTNQEDMIPITKVIADEIRMIGISGIDAKLIGDFDDRFVKMVMKILAI